MTLIYVTFRSLSINPWTADGVVFMQQMCFKATSFADSWFHPEDFQVFTATLDVCHQKTFKKESEQKKISSDHVVVLYL